MSVADWIAEGIEAGHIVFQCATHGSVILTDEAELEFEQGYDPCVPVLALTVTAQKQLESSGVI